ncbi:MAG: OmpH family outer membrane protein [Phycisphaerae bacterium]|nr:OmpH family outer membrane protein [Phycisphaerae bacterium]
MNRFWLAAGCAGVVAMGAATARAAQASPKVAVINLSKVFDQYRLTKDLETLFESKQQQMAAQAKQKTDEITVKRQELARFKPDSDDYKTRRAEVEKMEVEFEVWAGTQERQIRDEHKAWLLRIYQDVHKAVEELSAEKGINLVLTYDEVTDGAPDSKTLRQQLLLEKVFYFAKELDLTQEAIERLNKNYTPPENAARTPIEPTRTAQAAAAPAAASSS